MLCCSNLEGYHCLFTLLRDGGVRTVLNDDAPIVSNAAHHLFAVKNLANGR